MENLKNVAPIEDFNWDAYENGEAVTNASHEELEKAYDGTLNKVNDREVVDGTVIAMNKREVVVYIGYKSDGIIPLNEFRYNPDLKVGGSIHRKSGRQKRTARSVTQKSPRYSFLGPRERCSGK